MPSPLLVTKLFIPPTRQELVSRPGLLKRLSDGCVSGNKLSLISAPAGFGKTTLLSHWVETIREKNDTDVQHCKVAWLSMDEDDNDPVRFLNYFIAALNQNQNIEAGVGQGALSMLQSPQPPSTNTVLISLINDLAAFPEKIIFVLDDYHLIEAEGIHHAIDYLLENLPPQLHLVIATRHDPLLSLGRLRARGQLTELRAANLRFSASETADFLNQVMGLNLSPDDIAELESRTEGWIAGLQLAGISMRGRTDPTSFINSFTGGHRLVLDFLIEEVLGQQPESIKNFLLQTAILDRLTGSLCDALTEQENCQETLEFLDRTNLFIIPLDEERHWYRYHHLFSDLLRQQLHQTRAHQWPELQRKASEWYAQNGLTDEAIKHALLGKDFERAVWLLSAHMDALWQRGEHIKLRRWLQQLPDKFLESEPQLGIIRAYYLHYSGHHEQGGQLLERFQRVLDSQDNDDETGSLPGQLRLSHEEKSRQKGKLLTIRALIYAFSGEAKAIIQDADQALEYLTEQDLTWRNLAALALGDAHSFLGNMAESYAARLTALRACETEGNVYYIIIAALKLASTLREQGELVQVVELCSAQIRQAEKNGLLETIFVGCIKTLLGEILAELNELDQAMEYAGQGVKVTEQGQNLVVLGMSYLYLMRVFFSMKDLSGAEEVIEKVARLAREITVPAWLSSQMASWQAKIHLAQDDLASASNWAKKRGFFAEDEPPALERIDYFSLIDYIVFARVLIAQGRLGEARGLLDHLRKSAESGERVTRLIEIRMLQAITFELEGDRDQAMKPLGQAISLGAQKGFIRIFADEAPPMASLLYEALARGIEPAYVQGVLAALPAAGPDEAASTKPQVDQSGLIEPLSEREIEVLELIAKGLTNPEISSRLYLSPNTVKVHTRNIYGKLGVNNRTQAVARARTLGVLLSD